MLCSVESAGLWNLFGVFLYMCYVQDILFPKLVFAFYINVEMCFLWAKSEVWVNGYYMHLDLEKQTKEKAYPYHF